jgi:hypothetical protein
MRVHPASFSGEKVCRAQTKKYAGALVTLRRDRPVGADDVVDLMRARDELIARMNRLSRGC